MSNEETPDPNVDRELNRFQRYRARHRDRINAKARLRRRSYPGHVKAAKQRHREKHIEKIRENDWLAKHKGKLTRDELKSLIALQDGKCGICRTACAVGNRTVDHCHKTGAVRGVLCKLCNAAVGHLNDDPRIMRAAVRYLEHSPLDLMEANRDRDSQIRINQDSRSSST